MSNDFFDVLSKKSKPPFSSAQFKPSSASSTQIIEGVFIVLPSNIPFITF